MLFLDLRCLSFPLFVQVCACLMLITCTLHVLVSVLALIPDRRPLFSE